MSQAPSVERRLMITLFTIACVAIVGVLAILPYRLYSRDIQQATTDAHRISSVVHTALSHALLQEDLDQASLADLVNRLQGMGNVEVRMRRLESGEIHPVAASGRGSSTRRDTELTYVAPPIIDRSGETWLATMDFDLSPMKRRSIRLITDRPRRVVVAQHEVGPAAVGHDGLDGFDRSLYGGGFPGRGQQGEVERHMQLVELVAVVRRPSVEVVQRDLADGEAIPVIRVENRPHLPVDVVAVWMRLVVHMILGFVGGAFITKWATSTRKPSAPRSSQNRMVSNIAARSWGFRQLRSGCSLRNECR